MAAAAAAAVKAVQQQQQQEEDAGAGPSTSAPAAAAAAATSVDEEEGAEDEAKKGLLSECCAQGCRAHVFVRRRGSCGGQDIAKVVAARRKGMGSAEWWVWQTHLGLVASRLQHVDARGPGALGA